MASLKDMRVRIAATKATQKITKAMQMVAASKLRRAQAAAEAARPYAQHMREVLVNIARFLKVDPEQALRKTNAKFRRRFGYVEQKLAERGRSTKESSIEEMESLWQEAKK